MKFNAPNIESILAFYINKKPGWEKGTSYEGSQNTIPVDGQIHRKIGITPGEKVLFFAGGGGNWAESIANKTSLTFSDLTKRIVERVGKKREIGEKQITINALRVPVKRDEFDWSVSFEPVPLAGQALPLAVLRGLLNRRGVKIIRYDMYSGEERIAKVLGQVYGTETEEKRVGIKCKAKPRLGNRFTGRETKTHLITTIYSNDKIKNKVEKDLKIMMLVEKLKGRGGNFIPIKKIVDNAVEKGIKKSEVIESLGRINQFSELIPEEKRVTLVS